MPVKKYQQLVKRTATGAVEEWDIRVEGKGGDKPATIIVTHGLRDGKKQTSRTDITEGKNRGKANETTPYQQAVKEAQAEWTKKKDRKHYGLTVEESAGKREAAPMLAKVYEDYIDKVDWSCAFGQPKYDGNRCWAVCEHGSILLVSRQGKPIVSAPHIVEELAAIMSDGETFDGELYVHGLPLNQIRSLIARPQDDSAKLELRLYDAVLPLPFEERHDYLHTAMVVEQRGPLHLVPTTPLADADALMKYQALCLDEGFEGAMLRHGRASYEAGKRSASLLKVKTFREGEFTVQRVIPTNGTFALTSEDSDEVRHVKVAKFVLQTVEGYPFEVTAPGNIAAKLYALKHPDEFVGRTVTIKYQTYTATKEPVPFLPVATGYPDEE